jgi:hypothetical protein
MKCCPLCKSKLESENANFAKFSCSSSVYASTGRVSTVGSECYGRLLTKASEDVVKLVDEVKAVYKSAWIESRLDESIWHKMHMNDVKFLLSNLMIMVGFSWEVSVNQHYAKFAISIGHFEIKLGKSYLSPVDTSSIRRHSTMHAKIANLIRKDYDNGESCSLPTMRPLRVALELGHDRLRHFSNYETEIKPHAEDIFKMVSI